MIDLGRTSEKKRLSFGHCPKGSGVQPESKSFEVVLFSPLLDTKWGEGGVDHVPKVLRHFLPKFWVKI